MGVLRRYACPPAGDNDIFMAQAHFYYDQPPAFHTAVTPDTMTQPSTPISPKLPSTPILRHTHRSLLYGSILCRGFDTSMMREKAPTAI